MIKCAVTVIWTKPRFSVMTVSICAFSKNEGVIFTEMA